MNPIPLILLSAVTSPIYFTDGDVSTRTRMSLTVAGTTTRASEIQALATDFSGQAELTVFPPGNTADWELLNWSADVPGGQSSVRAFAFDQLYSLDWTVSDASVTQASDFQTTATAGDFPTTRWLLGNTPETDIFSTSVRQLDWTATGPSETLSGSFLIDFDGQAVDAIIQVSGDVLGLPRPYRAAFWGTESESFVLDGLELELTARTEVQFLIPEPSAVFLASLGFMLAGYTRRHRPNRDRSTS